MTSFRWYTNWRSHRQGELRTDPQRLVAYFADRRLMWRNVLLIMIGNLGYGVALLVINPLMLIKMKDCGVSESWIGGVQAVNLWAASFLVMYFGWQSDHLVSRFGRRTPYLLIAAPPIILAAALFPFFHNGWVLLSIYILQWLFLDMKLSTYSLILIDTVPRKELASLQGLSLVVPGVCNFFTMRYGFKLVHISEPLPYLIGAGVMAAATLIAGLGVVEPPIYNPTTERFKPWSTMKVAWQDKRIILLMLAVGMVVSFQYAYGDWAFLFAKVDLHLDLAVIGSKLSWASLITVAMAYPVGWIIDHIGGRRVVVVYWLMQVVAFAVALQISSAQGLLGMAVLLSCAGPLYAAADIMVFKSAPPEHVGAFTSSNSFLRNAIHGCMWLAGGLLIRWSGYHAAFVLGIIVSTVGLILFFLHKWAMRPAPQPLSVVADNPAAVQPVCE